jgi:hypothetical protein
VVTYYYFFTTSLYKYYVITIIKKRGMRRRIGRKRDQYASTEEELRHSRRPEGDVDRHEAGSIRINLRMVRFDLPSQSMAERVRGRARWSVGVAWDGRKHIPYLCGRARGSVGERK